MLELAANELVDRLAKGGVEEWNRHRQGDLADQDLHLTFESFRSAELPEDLSGIDLSRAVIEGGVISSNIRLADANLRWSEFSSFSLGQANDFSGADLRSADFAFAQLQKCSFANADLRGANFSFTLLARAVPSVDPETDKIKDVLRGTNFGGAKIESLNLFGCKIQTELGYLPESVGSVDEFESMADKAGMNHDGISGMPQFTVEWQGHFKTYRPR